MMALRNQPYLPLYVQDFLTDEKLVECSASATGVYIRLMCIMHKSELYGTILLKQKDEQTDNQIDNFALKLVKSMPYAFEVVRDGLAELLDENVLTLADGMLIQRRMVKDFNLSVKRSEAGREGGLKTQFAKAKYKANGEANPEYEYEYESEVEVDNEDGVVVLKQPKISKKELIERAVQHYRDLWKQAQKEAPELTDWVEAIAKAIQEEPFDRIAKMSDHIRLSDLQRWSKDKRVKDVIDTMRAMENYKHLGKYKSMRLTLNGWLYK